ncbi:MAG: hypothetical protein CMJ36_02705 [Phycisphaerae bacterium]|nr:hypothetical protein [Phycisphaerae bacterium]
MTTHPDQYAALTALFTTDSAPPPPLTIEPTREPEIVAIPSPRIECLIPGHLPVRAHAWFLPCARSLVGKGVPGVLARIDGEQVQLTSFGKEREALDACQTLPELARCCGQWLLLPESPFEPASATGLDADRITILTGADQAALVAAYQVIKSIVAGAMIDPEKLDLGLFIAGSPERTAQETAGRLSETALEQLGCSIAYRGSIQRIELDEQCSTGIKLPLAEGGIDEFVSEVRSALASSKHSATEVPEDPRPLPLPPEKSWTPPVEPGEAEFTPAKLMPAPSVIKPIADEDMSVPASSDHGFLASHVEGLALLPIRCPAADEVELAVDESGRVHCLSQVEELRSLLVVEAWVMSHGTLLEAACPEQVISDATPVLHGFTSTPMEVADLHSAKLQLHLLVEVEAGNAGTWFSTRLS